MLALALTPPTLFHFLFVEAMKFLKSCKIKLFDRTELKIYITIGTVCVCMESYRLLTKFALAVL